LPQKSSYSRRSWIQACNCVISCKTIIIGTTRLCAKFG
jgi:hypothetical protein